jgi:hypothetical protein
MVDTFPLPWRSSSSSPSSSAAKEHIEDIIMSSATATTLGLESFETVFIIFNTFLFIRKDFVRSRYFFEFLFVSAFIGMMFYGELSICLFDFFRIC